MTNGMHTLSGLPLGRLLAAAIVTAAVLVVVPAEANMLARGTGVGGAAHSVKKNLEELADHADEFLGAVIEGDEAGAGQALREVLKTPAKIVRDTFPVLTVGAAAWDRLQTAGRRIKRFAGRADDAVADARAALATGNGGTAWLDGEPLSLPNLRRHRPADSAAPARGWDATPASTATPALSSDWDEATETAEDRKRQAWLEEQRRMDARPARWEAARKEAERLEAEQVRRYANDYWARRVTDAEARPSMDSLQPGTLAYDNYREMMHTEGWADTAGGMPDDYSAALAGLPDEQYGIVEDEHQAAPGDYPAALAGLPDEQYGIVEDEHQAALDDYSAALAGLPDEQHEIVEDDYQAALDEVQEKEAEQKRLAEEERRRQAELEEQRRLEEEEKQRRAELDRQRQREEAERAEERRQARLAAERRQERERRRAAQAERERQRAIERREARNRAADRQQMFDNFAESLRQYNEQMQQQLQRQLGGSNSGGSRGGQGQPWDDDYCPAGWVKIPGGGGSCSPDTPYWNSRD